MINFEKFNMRMKQIKIKKQIQRASILLMFFIFSFQIMLSQELFVSSNSELYLKKDLVFTTSNTVVTIDPLGTFSLEAGNNWGSDQEYVNGKVVAYGTGGTKMPVGNNNVYAPVIANHTSTINATYFNTSPVSGSNGLNVDAVSNVEYWELSGNAIITLPWIENSDITSLVNNNGGVLNSVAIVGYNTGTWNLVNASQTNTVSGNLLVGEVESDVSNEINLDNFSQFTFGIDHQVALAVNDLFLSTGIQILSNPVRRNNSKIQFRVSSTIQGINITMYSLLGQKIKYYPNISTSNGIGTLQKPNVKSGLYFLKFDYEGKQGVKKIIIE